MFKNKNKNRHPERENVLDVRMHSRYVRALWMKRFGRTGGWLLGLALTGTLGWVATQWGLKRFVYENPTFAIRNLDVRTDGLLPHERVTRWTGVSLGENLFAVDLQRVKRDLKLNSFVRDVAVDRVLPGTLWVRITEREPVAQFTAWTQPSDGAGWRPVKYFLDRDGHCLMPSDLPEMPEELAQYFAHLPVLKNVKLTDTSIGKPAASPTILAALNLISTFSGSLMDGVDEVREIDVADAQVLRVMTQRNSRITLAFEGLAGQLDRWRVVHDYAQNSGKAIASLDLSVSNNIPALWQEISAVPSRPPSHSKPPRLRKKHV